MAKRRNKGSGSKRNIVIASGIIIAIAVGAFYTVPEFADVLSSVGLNNPELVLPIADEGKWTLPTVFRFALAGDFDGVHCVIQMDITKNNKDGTKENFIAPTELQVELFEIIGGTTSSAKPAQSFTGAPKISCWDTTFKTHTAILQGGSITTSLQIADPTSGLGKTLISKQQTIPTLNQNLMIRTGGGNVILPEVTLQASVIENELLNGIVPDTVAEYPFNIFFNTKGFASVKIDSTTFKAGDLSAGAGGDAKFLNPNFDVQGTGTGKGTNVILQTIVPTQFYYLGGATPVPSGVTLQAQVIRDGDRMVATFTGVQDNWSSSEGQPTLTIKSPTGKIITSAQMSFSRSITGGLSEFKTTLAVPINIGANNIDLWKGTWKAEMKQSGRLQVGSGTFALGDYRDPEFIPVVEICAFPKIVVGGECVDQATNGTEPTPDQCPDAVDLLLAVQRLSDTDLKTTWQQLVSKENSGILDVCEVKVKPLVETEMLRRGFSLTEQVTPVDPDDPPIIPAGSAKAYIRYAGSYTDAEAVFSGAMVEDCKNDALGIVPPQGLAITGFQLLGLNSCDGFRFGTVELVPTLDFGSDVNAVTIEDDGFSLKQNLIITVNQPLPDTPTFACITPTSSNPAGTCSITNFAEVTNKVGNLGASAFTSIGVTNFVDKATSGEYQIVKSSIKESLVIDKIQRNGVALNDGDQIEVLYSIYGTFRGTHNGESFVGKLPTPPTGQTGSILSYKQSYKFETSIGTPTCEDPSKIVFIEDATNPEPRLASGDETGQCTPCGELETLGLGSCPEDVIIECIFPATPNVITGDCEAPDDDTCSMGQVRDLVTGQCRDQFCQTQETIPMCQDGQFQEFSATLFDDCGIGIVSCVGGDGGAGGNGGGEPEPRAPCPSPVTQYRDSLGICVNIDSDGCASGQALNNLGVCEVTGGITNPEPPTAPPVEDVNLCSLDQNFNLGQCLASLFSGTGTGGFEITGTTAQALLVVVMIAILVIVIAVIVRKRRAGGLGGLKF